MSFYTKYRPQTIAELDLDSARSSLSNILKSGKFSQVYLFSGPKGTGKTSSARIVAKLLNCETNRDHSLDQPTRTVLEVSSETRNSELFEPCNKCDSCRRITTGQSLACLELDAASNRGIDNIRELRERIGLAPAEGRFTVYIIDEVHMLTTEAFNALLKTLEEPPAHAIFVLCTTDPQKIPDTVISRCTRINFTKATAKEVIHSLEKAIKGENLTIEPEALNKLAISVDGSFRDGMKLLEQSSLINTTISLSMIDEITGNSSGYQVELLLQSLRAKNIQTALTELRIKQEQGVEAFLLGKRLIEAVRIQLVTAMQTKSADTRELIRLADEIDETVRKIRGAVIPYLPLEIMAGEWCFEENKQLPAPVPQSPIKINAKFEPTPNLEPKSPIIIKTISEPVSESKITTDKSQPPALADTPKVTVRSALIDAFTGTLEDITKQWSTILVAVRPYNHSLEALLKSTKLITYQDGWLTIEAFYKFHKEQLEQDRHRRVLEDVISKTLQGKVNLHFTIRQSVKADSSVDNISGKVEDDALVKAAEEIFSK